MRRKIEKEQIKLVTWQSKSSETETVNSNWKSSASQTGVSGWTLDNQGVVGHERIQEIENPELSMERMQALYEKKG